MRIFSFLNNHHHYWGIPHERLTDKSLIQTCYECGAERRIKVELRPDAVSRISEVKAA